MDKKDIAYLVGALVIILVIAVVIKPLATGEPVNTGISFPATIPESAITPVYPDTVTSTPLIPRITTTPPTPVPTWDAKIKTIGFVDPGTYGISMNDTLPAGTRVDSTSINKSTTSYATISGKYRATSQIIDIPFPYWELWYTVDPAGPAGGKGQSLSTSTVSGSKESGSTHTVIQGSFSVTQPVFTIQVMDAEDPNRIVRTISPPGGLDSSLWKGTNDPRPWKERFFEGSKKYYFVIDARALNSYNLDIRVPTGYIGKF
ncbi:MAG: hypothetical protein LUQ54_00500 [Methanoregula sp.]|nr:hypothetical protein [Methanoregula sp.]